MTVSVGAAAAPAGAVPPGPNGETPRVSTATGASVPAPAVTGPVANTSPVGDPAHGYPFLATDVDLAEAGYVEEEYLISGQANRYTTSEHQHGHGAQQREPLQHPDRGPPAGRRRRSSTAS